ncbi:MAG: 2-hydroxychromene-2-carboxylate isomerase [bacterium]|nr:2-hydroxychromene-2-carboxylate isomerase [bacterium]
MVAPTPVEFWFEFASTYSYPAAMRIEAAAASAGVPLRWRPFLLGPIFKAQGWSDSPFNIYEAKGRYMWRDLARICARQGLCLTAPSRFPRNGLLAARVAAFGEDAPWLPAFVRGVYTANFADDREISEPAVLAELLRAVGLDPASTLAAAQEAPVKDHLRARTDEAIARGVFGAPALLVGDELFWGNDRIEDALAWATRHELPSVR